jgi:hypothetical protein
VAVRLEHDEATSARLEKPRSRAIDPSSVLVIASRRSADAFTCPSSSRTRAPLEHAAGAGAPILEGVRDERQHGEVEHVDLGQLALPAHPERNSEE